VLLAVFYCLSQQLAFSHEQKSAQTNIEYNSRSEKIEVVHRFSLHDAEHAVKFLFDKTADIYQSEATQAAFADYVHKHFSITDASDEAIPLTPIGYEKERNFFWVYAELMPTSTEVEWLIEHSAMQHIWPSQINNVFIEIDEKTFSLQFDLDNQSQRVSLTLPERLHK